MSDTLLAVTVKLVRYPLNGNPGPIAISEHRTWDTEKLLQSMREQFRSCGYAVDIVSDEQAAAIRQIDTNLRDLHKQVQAVL